METTRTSDTAQQTLHTESADDSSVSSLLSRLGSDISDLVSTEMRLARSEVGESVEDVKAGVSSLAISVVVLFAGVLCLLAAVCLALAQLTGLSAWLATLIVGAVVTGIGLALVAAGKKKLSAENLSPTRTQRALEKDKSMVERSVS